MKSFNYVTTLVLVGIVSSCVSVKLGPEGPEKAKNVNYQSPPVPFEKVGLANSDAAWKSSSTGSTIAYKSTCRDATQDQSLETIRLSLFTGVEDLKTLESEKKFYNGREALFTTSQASIDGIETKIENVVLKKNFCTFILTFAALPSNFQSEQNHFRNFVGSFEAP